MWVRSRHRPTHSVWGVFVQPTEHVNSGFLTPFGGIDPIGKKPTGSGNKPTVVGFFEEIVDRVVRFLLEFARPSETKKKRMVSVASICFTSNNS